MDDGTLRSILNQTGLWQGEFHASLLFAIYLLPALRAMKDLLRKQEQQEGTAVNFATATAVPSQPAPAASNHTRLGAVHDDVLFLAIPQRVGFILDNFQ